MALNDEKPKAFPAGSERGFPTPTTFIVLEVLVREIRQEKKNHTS